MSGQSFDDVLTAAQAQIRALQDSERKLSDQIEALRARNPQAPLSDQEKTQLADLRAAKDAVLDSIETVALVTLENLDNTDEVKNLANNIKTARESLQDTLDRIKTIGNLAQTVSDVLNGASQLEAKVTAIAARLGG